MTADSSPAIESDPTSRRVPASVRLAADWTWRLLLFIAVGALVVVLIGRLRTVVLPVFLGVLFAALLTPVVTTLRRVKVPPALAAALALLLLLGVLIGGIALVATSAVKQVEQLGPTLTNGVEELRTYLQDGPLHLGSERVDALAKSVTDALSRSSTYTGTVVSGASAGVSFLGGFVLAMFALFFFLKDGWEIRCWIINHMPRHWRPAANRAADDVWQSLTSYTRGAVAVAAFDGFFIGIGLLILDVPLALSLALLTFLAAFVPIVGAVLAGSVAVLVALATKGFGSAVAVLVLVILVQQLEGNVLQPVIMRRAVELHPLVVVTSVAAGATIAGVAGAALAVPVVAVLRVAITAIQRHADEVGEMPEDAQRPEPPEARQAPEPEQA